MKLLATFCLLGLTHAYSQDLNVKTNCYKSYSEATTEFKLACFEKLLYNQEDLAEEAKEFLKERLDEISESSNNDYIKFKDILTKYNLENNVDQTNDLNELENSDEIKNLISNIKSSNESQITLYLKNAVSNYITINKIRNVIVFTMKNTSDEQKRENMFNFFAGVYLNLANEQNSEIQEDFLKELNFNSYIKKYANSLDSSELTLKYALDSLKRNSYQEYQTILFTNFKQRKLIKSELVNEINNNEETLQKSFDFLLLDSDKFGSLLGAIYKKVSLERRLRIYDELANTNVSDDLFKSLFQLVLEDKELLAKRNPLSLLNSELNIVKLNLLKLAILTSSKLSNDIALYLESPTIDLNVRMQLVCQLGTTENKDALRLYSKILLSNTMLSDIKLSLLDCLKTDNSIKLINTYKRLLADNPNSKIYFKTLLNISPYSSFSNLVKYIQKYTIATNEERLEVIKLLINSKIPTESKFLVDYINDLDINTYIKASNTLFSKINETEDIIYKLALSDVNNSIRIIQLLNKYESEAIINRLLNEVDLRTLSHSKRNALFKGAMLKGNYQTLVQINELKEDVLDIVPINILEAVSKRIESRVDLNKEKANELLKNLEDISSLSAQKRLNAIISISDILTKKWNIRNLIPSFNLSDKELVVYMGDINDNLISETINKVNLDTFYKIYETISSLNKISFNCDDFYHFNSKLFYALNLDSDTNIPVQDISELFDSLINSDYLKDMKTLENYVVLRSLIKISNFNKYQHIISLQKSRLISDKLLNDLKEIIRDISPYHKDLSQLSANDIEDIINARSIFNADDASLISSNNPTQKPLYRISLKGDVKVAPGIYKCPTTSDCAMIIAGKFDMDPFSLIIANHALYKDQYITPTFKIVAQNIGNIYADLSAKNIQPTNKDKAAPGHPQKWKTVYSHHEPYCVFRVYYLVGSACLKKSSRAVYVQEKDGEPKAGGSGFKGTTGNHGGNLIVSFYPFAGVNHLYGEISLISNGAIGGNGGDGGDANGGPRDGYKGQAGAGGDAGNLISDIIYFRKELSNKFSIMAKGGEPGKNGKGTGETPVRSYGQDGRIMSDAL